MGVGKWLKSKVKNVVKYAVDPIGFSRHRSRRDYLYKGVGALMGLTGAVTGNYGMAMAGAGLYAGRETHNAQREARYQARESEHEAKRQSKVAQSNSDIARFEAEAMERRRRRQNVSLLSFGASSQFGRMVR